MNRREFLSTLVGGVSVSAAVRTWPFRVFSFPTELRILSLDELRSIYIERALAEISRDMANSPLNGVGAMLCSASPDLILRSLPPDRVAAFHHFAGVGLDPLLYQLH